jgi:hypothetical protein
VRILVFSSSMLLNGKRPWRGNLKERYEQLVNTFVNTTSGAGEKEEETSLEFVSEKRVGGAGGTRTPYLFNAIEALSQMSYSPKIPTNVQLVSYIYQEVASTISNIFTHQQTLGLPEFRYSCFFFRNNFNYSRFAI